MGALPKTSMALPEFFSWWEKQGEDTRFELVDGVAYAMGRDRIRHNNAKLRVVTSFQNAIKSAKVDCRAFVDGIGVSPDNKNYRLPDAVVNCGPADPEAYILPNPVIVVEVVSPSSEARDVHEKLIDYFAIKSVCHYLIVFEERGRIVHHRRQNSPEKIETTFLTTGLIELTPPGISIAVSDLLKEGADE
jgi:Uma2 family endonuclease